MPLPQPEDFADRIRKLEQEVRDLRSSLTNRGGLTSASAGWQIPDQDLPATPASGGHLTAVSSEPYWTDSSGSSYSLKPMPSFTGTSTPQYPLSFSSPATVTGTVQDTHYNLLRADIVNQVFLPLRDVINKGATTDPPLWPAP